VIPAARLALALSFAFVAAAASAQTAPAESKDYTPQVGQSGKDVVWVPTPDALVERMLRMARVGPKDYVIDLGSGDGRTVIAAGKLGARDKVKFIKADIFETDFNEATVITMYLLPSLNVKLRPKLLDMRPGTRIVSHAFNMEDWQPDQTVTVEGRDAYLWIVPAKVGGSWKLTVPAGNGEESWQLALAQQFQRLSGGAKGGSGKSFDLVDAKLTGPTVKFTFVDANGQKREFNGRVSGNKMEGTTQTQGGTQVKWTAVRGA
jgi:hypothetical protein